MEQSLAVSVNTLTFCQLSFEGPDRYALAGALGILITRNEGERMVFGF